MRVACFSALALLAAPAAADPLPDLSLAPEVTVSGLSSGAFMAVQLQTAFSASVTGAGVVAGGPYDCAGGSVYRALFVCMDQFWIEPGTARTLETIAALEGRIDPPERLADDRVYLFHGTWDDTVGRPAMDALAGTYAALGVPSGAMSYVTDVEAGHGFLTEAGQVECHRTAPDFLNDCDIDQAGDILSWLLGPLAPGQAVPDHLRSYDQGPYAEGATGLGETGFVYVPASCAAGETCRLHIALHGCKQGAERIGDAFARRTGYNAWAEANRIVVLYPQAATVPGPWYNVFGGNPNGCWDWWGYGSEDYLSREAPQIAAIGRMAAALGAALAP
ncbi:extracellular catalytic domain type 2 short-chain-length polyhydroxyalkanoate depolymerase [Salipiger mucosus]|uniref:Poly (3-hydroxybutyrate) depolymerase n=1 Tax=Salipiger mucosus DSM 16094 TaxID=1123237 RepID=S9R4S8_9RHOB|nr:PHB depolymerase family esterase [Salipiger mucosus]EPX86932.1 poly (3-hydroxybutyrate) depolymerase [Salipiger mucosus DSM 16094]